MWESDAPAWLRPRTDGILESCARSSCFQHHSPFRRRLSIAVLAAVLFVFASVAVILPYAHPHFLGHGHGGPRKPGQPPARFPQPDVPAYNETASQNLEKPPGFRIVALVFYGRRDRVSILDCYLQRNLVRNGGVLDEVLFLPRTDNAADLAWLDQKVDETPDYVKADDTFNNKTTLGGSLRWDFSDMWRVARRGVMYVKIDDDVLYIEDAAIPAIVHRRLQQPDAYLVSANVINHNRFAWLHRKMGAVLPYLPDSKRLRPRPHGKFFNYDWRASSLPMWSGRQRKFDRGRFDPPPHRHRWLPTHESSIDNTPVSRTEEPAGTAGASDWMVGAQQHYTLLHRLENNDLEPYRFSMWDVGYERMSINFIAVWGDDIVSSRPIAADDEEYLTVTAPKALKRHVIADGRGIVAHFSYGRQREGMEKTDLLDRYRAYANENICPKKKM